MKNHKSFRLLGLFGLLGIACLLSATGRGPKGGAIAYPSAGEYNKLIVNSAFDVSFSDSVKSAMITLPENLQKQLVVDLDKDVLRIALRGKAKLKKRPIVVLPRNKRLNNIELTGAATLTVDHLERNEMTIYLTGASCFRGDITAKQVNIEQAGASDYRGKLFVDNVSLNLSAASTAEIRGRALIKMDIRMIEASSIDAEKFEVKRIEGSLDGASNAIFWCTERMIVPVKNASHITYIGRPLVVNCPASDVSTVTHK